ncbi:MAG: hypothetical protein AAFN70_08470, partial [Planctomycetota bacterium]
VVSTRNNSDDKQSTGNGNRQAAVETTDDLSGNIADQRDNDTSAGMQTNPQKDARKQPPFDQKKGTAKNGGAKLGDGPLARLMKKSKSPTSSTKDASKTTNQSATKPATGASKTKSNERSSATEKNTPPAINKSNLKYGLLKNLGNERYVSPEGLMYVKGSAEGHRLRHLERHTKDQPSRPGSHGVFDGGMEKALKTIDNAYKRAKKNYKTTKQVDDRRTIYTVDLGGRIGYVGGKTGNRDRKPMARRVKIVLEGNKLITAYPTK